MKPENRLILSYVVRLVFMVLAGWIAVAPDALPGAHPVTRFGLAALFLVFSVVLGEVTKLGNQFELLMRALRAATGKAEQPGTTAEAIPILIRALDSREEATREKAHRNLVRLTGQDLPPERKAWDAWWKAEGRSAG